MIRIMREDAVSPVLGVILMVAITVILAAVIASFVFGMSQSVRNTPYVGITAQQVGTDIRVTYAVSPTTGETVENLTIRLNGVYNGSIESPVVGDTITLDGMGTSAPDHVVVTATFSGGRQAIVLDTNV